LIFKKTLHILSYILICRDVINHVSTKNMGMQPLEKKKDYSPIILKLIILVCLIATGFTLATIAKKIILTKKPQNVLGDTVAKELKKSGSNLLDEINTNTQAWANDILGVATKTINKTANQATESISDYVFDNTVGNLLKQIDKLPEKQREDIKRNICK